MDRQPLAVLHQPDAPKIGKLPDRGIEPRTDPQWPMLANTVLAYDRRALAAAVVNQPSVEPRRIGQFDRAIAAKTSDPAFYSNRGLAHERLGNRERACADYKKACDLGECDFFKSYKAEGNCR